MTNTEPPISRRRQSIADTFQGLATTWRNDVRFTSSITEMVTHPAYQQIIGMGPAVLPLIFRELEQRPDHWFWALKAITGVDPVKVEQRGKVEQMAKAWLQWGREQGYE